MTEKDYTGKKVAFCTLGCKLNFSETSSMARKFEALGFERVDYKEVADVYVLNSCSVTAESDKKSRNLIRSAIKKNPQAVMMVTGCYAQLRSSDIAGIQGVDYILGSGEKMNITSYVNDLAKCEQSVIKVTDYRKINNYFSAYSYGDRTRTFLKVQDGCNYFCTYCTIPMARGKSRNDSIENIVAEARIIAEKQIKQELIIDKVILDNEITVTEEEVNNRIEEIAESTNQKPLKVRAMFERNKTLENLKEQIKREKAIEILSGKVSIVEK